MPNICDYFKQGQLALAAYAKLLPGVANVVELQRAGFSTTLANDFGDGWRIVDQIGNSTSGLSATVFQEVSTGKRYLAIRGTDDLADLATDLLNVALLGTMVRQPQYSVLRTKVQEWIDNGTLPARFTVTGHSLGGFLAVGIAAEFATYVEHTYLYNAPGLNGVLGIATAPILWALGIAFPVKSSSLSNIRADAGVSPIAGLGAQLTPPIRIVIEDQLSSDVPNPPAARNHSQDPLTDALAIYALFNAIDPALEVDQIGNLLKAASAQNNRTLEASLDALRQIFGFNDETPTEIRNSLYSNIHSLTTTPLFRSIANTEGGANALAGRIVSLVGMDATNLAANAKSDFGYLFALSTLTSFAAIHADNIFSATHGELYDQWQADQSLTTANRSAGQGNFSDAFLQDRAQFLTWKNQKNLNDIADGVPILRKDNGVASYLFTDKALKDSQGHDYSIRVVGGNTLQQIDPIRISFASDQGDSLQGGYYADHLYGGRGKDTLAGGEGDDYLEGGAGDDTLTGEAGDDTLIGGNGADTLIGGYGDDTLQGGRGDDILQGGAGNDIYLIRAGDGRDTVLDHEGRNTIVYEDTGGQRTVLALSAFAVAGLANTWRGPLAGGGTAEITRNSPLTVTLPDGTQFIVDEYQDGDCGINLQEPRDNPIATREINGDLWPIQVFDESGNFYNLYDDLGNVVVDLGHSAVGQPDSLWGSEGNDFISTGEGRDVVLAMGGDDWIRAGGADDYLDGGDGDDVIEGRFTLRNTTNAPEYESRYEGGNGDDRLYADEAVELSQDLIELAIAEEWEGTVGPTLSGGPGDDILVGSNCLDNLFGGLGKDFIAGLGGRDVILGDSTFERLWPVPRDQLAQEPDFPYYTYGNFPRELAEGDDDVLFGGTGGDEIWGQGGDDWISGGEGDDFIVGGRGSDTMLGGAGNDVIYAGGRYGDFLLSDDDVLDGGDGDDTLISTSGDNVFLGGAGDDKISCGSGDNLAYGGDGNDQIRATGSGHNEFYGEAGNDSLTGGSGDDYLDGGDGHDVLIGNAGADIMLGGAGNDFLDVYQDGVVQGGEGNDIYQFRLGAGTNTVVDDLGSNRLVIFSLEYSDWLSERPLEPVSRDSVQLYVEGNRYRIAYGDRGDEIILGSADFAALTGLTLRHMVGYRIEYPPGSDSPQQVENYDDELLPLSQLAPQYLGYGDSDYLIGKEGASNTLDGKDGDDFLIGGSRDDTLIGGAGNDVLDGGDGGDRYIFNPGDGVDVVFDSGTQGADTLAFGPGIDPESLTLGVAGALLIRIGDTGDAVYVDGFDPDDASAAGAIERYEFADGTVLSQAQLISRGFDLYGTDNDDVVFGTSAADRFHASSGDDIMVGGAGDDIYYFGFASGHDSIVDQDTQPENVDTVVLGDGITPENLTVLSGPGLLRLATGVGDSLDIQWQPQDGSAIERVRFADGTIWDGAALEAHAVPAVLADPPGNSDGGSGAPAENSTPIVVSLESPNLEAPGSSEPGTSSVNDVAQYDAAAIDALRERVAEIRADAVPPSGPSPQVPAAGIVLDDIASQTSAGGAPATELPHSAAIPSIPAPGDSATRKAGLQTVAAQSKQDDLLSALSQSGQFDSLSAPTLRSGGKPFDLSSAQPGSAPAGFSSGADPLFGPLRPTQPSMQAWLDDWLGPRARASAGARENAAPADIEDTPPPMEEFSPRIPQDDIHETQPAEALTPDEIAQRYENIASWLADHPGIEAGSAMASGSAPQRNLFASLGAGPADDVGFGAAGVFGQSPGMAAIGGNALQPLRGINEGYTPLGVV